MRKYIFAVTAFVTLMGTSAYSHDYKLGDLEIVHPHTRPTPPKAPVSSGYLIIRNTGAEDDRLIGGSAYFAGKLELHEMKIENDIMKMREIGGGVVIPAGGEVTLEPGGLHIMFMQLKEQIREGGNYAATLDFEKSGSIEVEFTVDSPQDDHSGHSMEHE